VAAPVAGTFCSRYGPCVPLDVFDLGPYRRAASDAPEAAPVRADVLPGTVAGLTCQPLWPARWMWAVRSDGRRRPRSWSLPKSEQL